MDEKTLNTENTEQQKQINDTSNSDNIINENQNNESESTTTEQVEEKSAEKPKRGWNRWKNKHKIPGKHKLKYDSIFKGKQDEEEDTNEYTISHRTEGFEIDRGSSEWNATYEFEEYVRLKNLKQDIYNIITSKTDINLKANRRKPGRNDFNLYYELLMENLDMTIYSHSEVFIELSYYFSENELNMFKLLDQKWGTKIVKELSTKYNISKIDGIEFI
jgi:hypothetical protein